LNTGRFTVDVSTTPAEGAPDAEWDAWRPAFGSYEVVVTGYKGKMWPTGVRSSLEDYVGQGGGLVLIHATLATFVTPNLLPGEQEWSAFSAMMARGWRPFFLGSRLTVDDASGEVNVFPPPAGGSSGHGIQHSFVVKSRRPAHPILAGLPAEWLHGKDELYHAMRGPGPAVGIDVLASAFSDPATAGTGQHEPMLWETRFGLGRVVTTVMGHRWFGNGYGAPGSVAENGPDALNCVGLQTLIARSAEWAAGADVTVPVPAAFPSPLAVSLRDPRRGVWLQLGLKINGQHPPSDVVTTAGPLALTLDLSPGLWSSPLDLYFGYVSGGSVVWLTAGGPAPMPSPLTRLTPAARQGIPLLNTALPPGSALTFVMFLADGGTLVSYDVVSAVVQP
jgi:uncharacterized protein